MVDIGTNFIFRMDMRSALWVTRRSESCLRWTLKLTSCWTRWVCLHLLKMLTSSKHLCLFTNYGTRFVHSHWRCWHLHNIHACWQVARWGEFIHTEDADIFSASMLVGSLQIKSQAPLINIWNILPKCHLYFLPFCHIIVIPFCYDSSVILEAMNRLLLLFVFLFFMGGGRVLTCV